MARPSVLSYDATLDSLEAAPSSLTRIAVAARALAASGLTPVASPLLSTAESRFTLPSASGPTAVGLIPGRNPLLRSNLVVLGVDADAPQAPAVLEAARTLVERSTWADVPGRSVQVALWNGPSSRRRALTATLWPADAVYAVLEVGSEPSMDEGVETITGTDGLDLASQILSRVLEVTSEPAPPDTLAVR